MEKLYDLIIIGGGPSGLSAALYAGRAKLRTLFLTDDNTLSQISITDEVVNYPGIVTSSGAQIVHTIKKQAENFGVSPVNAKVDRVDFSGNIKKVYTQDGKEHSGIAVIISTGARPRTLGFVGEDKYTGRGIGYCATCDGAFFNGKDIFVVGGGLSAAQESIFLTRFAKTVYLIVREDELSVPAAMSQQVLSHKQIKVHFTSEVERVDGDELIRSITIRSNTDGKVWEHHAPEGDTFGVFVFVGYKPATTLFENVVELDSGGYIVTDDTMKTNVVGVYAAGDVRPKPLRQLVTAVADGAVAATTVQHYIQQMKDLHGFVVEEFGEVEEKPKETHESAIDSDIAQGLQPIFEKMEQPIVLSVIEGKDNPKLTDEMKGFASDLGALTDKIAVEILPDSGEEFLPKISISRAGQGESRIHYHGVPGGHEFNSFVLGMYNTSGPGQGIEPEILARIEALEEKEIFVGATLSCTMCPDVVQASQIIASRNPSVVMHMIDIGQFPEFGKAHNIMSVPAVVVGVDVSFGRKTLEQLLDHIEKLA